MSAPELSVHNESRRALLLGFASGGLLLAFGVPSLAHAAAPVQPPVSANPQYGGAGMPHGLRDDPNLFVAIAPDGTVTVTCIRSEMGQGVRTSVALVVADELGADWARVKVAQAVGDEPRYGNQNTDGSRSLRQSFAALRRAGAAARTMLAQAAAKAWGVDASQVKVTVHEVIDTKSGRKLGFGELAAKAAALPVPDTKTLALKAPAEFRYIGKGKTALIDGRDIVGGRAQYGIDTRLDGMLYAVVARPPAYGDTVESFDASAAEKLPGVVKIVQLASTPLPSGFQPLGGVAVIARDTWTAIQARAQLKIDWKHGPHAGYDSAAYRKTLEAAAAQPGDVIRNDGDAAAALAGAAKRVRATYYIPHLAHATMEPPAAVARVADGRCEVWTCTQAPQTTRDEIAKALGVPTERVTVNVTLLGGGFGRKSKPDYVVEAALLSKAVGAPVKLTFTREDDIAHDYFHAVSLEAFDGGIDASGKVVAWQHRTVAPSIQSTFRAGVVHEQPGELAQGIADLPFAIPNVRIENPAAEAHTRIGWFRSVYNIPHAFGIQSFVSELAHAAGRDPKDFLLELIGPARRFEPHITVKNVNYGEDPALYPVDTGRLRRVVETVAREAGWGRKLPKGHGLGIAAHRSFVSYTAAVCEVQVGADGKISVPRVDIAIDCGPQVNPERVRSQLEGAVVMGLGIALHGEITFKDGHPEQSNFNGFQVLRMNEAPREIRVHLVAPDDFATPLGGVGEPGLPPVAPALTNAIFAATGTRIRSLPVADQLAKPQAG
ncbi:xanthine dehydrogenase family protein molybdopterin-binding subunit [Burkholderia metallica]|uniref:xanthine dehydrogenase family protein molybdopterin-binding subunit n=1 Tax=Burkholderia metallica TaxID=488729 RepID=UPI00157522A0|nr:xanthine dehydrogenase family protein molybdopterin-binding subunit [Burkholderia metallica]NTZ05654.1 xanthine dehydrogenase family protein molybdopterin-binding subunit [Burkholderia metallica]